MPGNSRPTPLSLRRCPNPRAPLPGGMAGYCLEVFDNTVADGLDQFEFFGPPDLLPSPSGVGAGEAGGARMENAAFQRIQAWIALAVIQRIAQAPESTARFLKGFFGDDLGGYGYTMVLRLPDLPDSMSDWISWDAPLAEFAVPALAEWRAWTMETQWPEATAPASKGSRL